MASAEIYDDMACSTCLYCCSQLVSLRCGHNICEECMKTKEFTGENEQCLTCRTKMKQEEAEVLCTYCMQDPSLAIKTCLTCEASLCLKHLNLHNKSSEHTLVEPTSALHHQKCTIHNEVLEFFCHEDDTLVCASCSVLGGHKGHNTELLNTASEKKMEKLRSVLKRRVSRKERAQNRIKDLETEMSNVKDKAKAITDRVTLLFTDLRAQLDTLERRVVREVTKQEDQVINSLSGQVRELEIKIRRLSKQILDIKERCQITDPLAFLRGNLPTSVTLTNGCGRKLSDESVYQEESLDEVLISLTLHKNLAKVVSKINAMEGFHVLEASEIELDVNTAGDYVFISGDLKTACNSDTNLRRPERPERFYCVQVLSTKSFFSGQHSWEMETSHLGDWMIGVAYPTIERNGSRSFLGFNDQSWCLQRYKNKYSVKHNSEVIPIDVEYSCQRYLIYLDYEAGRLSFYQLSDPICHLHTFKTTFRAPLHAAFWVEDDAWVKILS